MTTLHDTRREPVFPRRLFGEQALFALMVWAGFTVFALLLPVGVSLVRSIEVSGWNILAQPARWFGFVVGLYVGYSLFPLHVTHGGTRKGFMVQSLVFTLAYGALLGALVTLTFVFEAGLYGLMDWPQALHAPQLYTSPLDIGLVMLQWLMIMTLWVAGGIFLGAAWYRNGALGAVGIVVGLFIAGLSAMATGGDTGPHLWAYQQLFGETRPGRGEAVAIHAASIAVFFALTWLAFKDAPIHNKKS